MGKDVYIISISVEIVLDTTVGELRTGSWYPQYNDIYRKWFGKDAPPQKFYLK